MKKLLLFSAFFVACSSSGPRNATPALPAAASVPMPVTQSSAKRAEYERTGTKYMISAQGPETAAAAARMFEAGGNIIDAMVAASFAISVERPHSTGIGGGGFLLFRQAVTGKVHAVDFRERAPLKATKNMYLDAQGEVVPKKSLDGIHSVAVPGLVAGLVEVHQRFGALPLATTLAPAIELAERGVPAYPSLLGAMKSREEVLRKFPATAKIFYKTDGTFYQEGDRVKQADLARTLREIAAKGRDGFYKGWVARSILGESRRLRGILSQKDFDAYQVKWREPVKIQYKGYDLFSMPPPSSGGIHVAQILNLVEHDDLRDKGAFSPEAIHLTAAAMQLAFADRAEYPGDPDFVKVPMAKLISKDYARERRALIGSAARPSSEIRAGKVGEESSDTTHFSIVDGEGNMVASTQTINYLFGSGVVAPGTGVVLNDEMDDFVAKPGVANVFGALGGDANAVAPKKTPLSSMSPTLVLNGDEPVLAVGAPGGTRIITCVAQTILNYLEYKMPLYESVAAIRFHHQWQPDWISMDEPGVPEPDRAALKKMGYDLRVSKGGVGCIVEAVAKEGSTLRGVADPRDIGAAVGR